LEWNENKPDPPLTTAPVKEGAKAVPLDADTSQSTDEQAAGVGSRWSLNYNFGDLQLSLLRFLNKSNANHLLICLYDTENFK